MIIGFRNFLQEYNSFMAMMFAGWFWQSIAG